MKPGRRQALKNRLKALGYEALALLREQVKAPIRVRSGNRRHVVTILVAPRDLQETPAQVGQWLSPMEAAVCLALQGGAVLQGKQIAARISQPYGPQLKYLLVNLRDRGIIRHESGEGFALVAPSV